VTFTKEDFAQAAREFNDYLHERALSALAKDDARRLALTKEPCPFWGDGVHCYAPGFVGTSSAFYSDRPDHMWNAKQCKCGARVRPAS
jgi:hypothetical protein